jgi:type II secretory pathway pseudopilin PulG
MLRALEILLGLILGCLGLLYSVRTVAGAVSFQKTLVAGNLSAVNLYLGISAVLLASLIFLAAWMLLRTPKASGVWRRRGRWLAVSGAGTSLLLLVAIAVPNYLRFSQAVSSSEPKVVLSAIRTAEEGYFDEFGEYVAFPSVPSGPPDQNPVDQIEYPEGAKTIGIPFALEEFPRVWCRYAVAVGSANEDGQAQAFTAEAICDTDADGVQMAWGYVRPDRETGEVIPGPFGRCPSEGPLDELTGQRSQAVVGPCDEKSGLEVF